MSTHPEAPKEEPFTLAANAVAEALDADVLIINSPIYRPLDRLVVSQCKRRVRRKNVILILVTTGGDPDAAYRIARILQDNYERVIFFATGICKSAGTLVAIGAHEIVVADSGELGPLDIQMSKQDELLQMQSGLTATAALTTLHEQAFQAFENFFLSLVAKSGNAISTKTATQIATQLTCGLFGQLYGHLDPMHVGEAGRALLITEKYGRLLNRKAGNLQPNGLDELLNGYPSHSFVIDRDQTAEIFISVREPSSTEEALVKALTSGAINPLGFDDKLVGYLSHEVPRPQVLPGLGGGNDEAVTDPQPHAIDTAGGADSGRDDRAPESPVAPTGLKTGPRPVDDPDKEAAS